MKILTTIQDIKKYAADCKAQGKTIGLVPTMGALHEGHLTLMRAAREKCDIVIASVFVNPTQFGPNEDYDAYPRQFAADCEKLESVNVDAVFHPEPAEMYPEGYCTYVNVDGDITHKLCGAQRPGHFRGVATVVTKLINLARADEAFFGQKDAQQAAVIKRMVRDLNFPVKIVVSPIVREESGLALSSRNKYLSEDEKQRALSISRSLHQAKAELETSQIDPETARLLVKESISAAGGIVDYVEVLDAETMLPRESPAVKHITIAVAAVFGKTRLIDNIQIKMR